MYPVMLAEKWETERMGGRGGKCRSSGKAAGAVGMSSRAHVLLFAPQTAAAGGGGCLGSAQKCLCWVRAPHSFVLAVGAAARLCSRRPAGSTEGAPE